MSSSCKTCPMSQGGRGRHTGQQSQREGTRLDTKLREPFLRTVLKYSSRNERPLLSALAVLHFPRCHCYTKWTPISTPLNMRDPDRSLHKQASVHALPPAWSSSFFAHLVEISGRERSGEREDEPGRHREPFRAVLDSIKVPRVCEPGQAGKLHRLRFGDRACCEGETQGR